MFSTSLLVAVLTCLLHGGWARYIALSLNLSLDALSQELRPGLSADMLQSCMKETEVSMSELNRFRLSELSNDPNLMDGIEDDTEVGARDDPTEHDEKQTNFADYDGSSPIIFNERNEESLQCFAHCLYEKLGLIVNGVFVEHDLYRKLYTILEREKTEVKECLNMESNNKCEAAYKMHLCYNRIKTIEAERRIREILEYGNGENDDIGLTDENDDGEDDANGDTTAVAEGCGDNNLPKDQLDGDPKRNEIERS